jgi:hypothetical protein
MQYADTPLLASVPDRDLSPSAPLNLAVLSGLTSSTN